MPEIDGRADGLADGRSDGWLEALDRFDRASSASADTDIGDAAWLPSDLPALPDELIDRATATLAAQRSALTLLGEQRAAAEQELAGLRVRGRAVASPGSSGIPVYLDVEG